MRRLPIIALLALVVAVPAYAATRQEHKFQLSFTSKAPGSATGMKFLTDRYEYKAPPAGQTIDRVKTVKMVLAKGTRLNTGAFKACSKSALEERGPMACPAGSKVGTGKATVITGLPIDPITLTAEIFVKRGGLLTYLTGSGQTIIIEMSVKGTTITAPVPRRCLIEDDCSRGEAVLKVLTVSLKPGKLVTTPSSCPKSGWTNKVVYAYVNGDTEAHSTTSKCKR